MRYWFRALIPALLLASSCAAQNFRFHGAPGKNGRFTSANYSGADAGKMLATDPNELANLEYLWVAYGAKLNQKDIDYLARLPAIIYLRLGQAALAAEYALSRLAALKSLESFELCKKDMKDEGLAFIADLPKIKHIEINASSDLTGDKRPAITDTCAEYLSRAKSLTSIDIVAGTALTDRFVSQIAGLPKLDMLRFDSDKLTDKSLGLLALRAKNLKWLDIGSRQFTDKGFKYVGSMKNMEKLSLRSESLTGECVKCVGELKRLRHLQLTVPAVDNAGFKAIAELPKLEVLAFRGPALTDDQFAMLRNHRTLQSAFLNGTKLTENPSEVIRSMPNLDHISFGRSDGTLQKVAEEEIARKRKARMEQNKPRQTP